MHDEFDFNDLTIIEIPVKYGGREYVLREASGGAAKHYSNAQARCMRLRGNEVTGIGNIGDLEPLLVHLCLFDENGKNVPQDVIESWPNRVQKKLYEKAVEISDISDDNLLRKQTLEALQRPDCPVSLQDLRTWAEKELPEKEFKHFHKLIKETPEEKAKNEQESSEDGY